MATSKAVRADDVSGLNIATASFTEDAVTKDVQRVIINNSTDGTMATVNATGLKVDASGAAVPVTVAATLNVRPSDGTNPITKTFDLDSGVGTEYNVGVGLRKVASGGSVEAGTSTDPLRTDPTGTTVQPVSGTVSITANSAVNVAQLAGTTTDTNSGVKSAGTLRVVLATDQPALTNKLLVTPDSVALPANQSVNVSQINAVTPLMGNGVTGTGSPRVTIASDNTAFSVNATVKPATSGGLSIKHLVAGASTNATNAKASAGQVYGWTIFNTNAATRYVKLHNTAGTPTAGSGVIQTIAVPPSGGNNWSSETGIPYATGIAFTTVTGIADADSTAVGANDLVIDIFYN